MVPSGLRNAPVYQLSATTSLYGEEEVAHGLLAPFWAADVTNFLCAQVVLLLLLLLLSHLLLALLLLLPQLMTVSLALTLQACLDYIEWVQQ